MLPKGMSKADLEARRLAAVTMVKDGLSRRDVARRLECAASSVVRWTQEFEAGGREAIRAVSEVGKQRPAFLDDSDRTRLTAILLAGPIASGFTTELWTLSRIRIVIEREFGVTYSVGHLHRVVTALGFSSQKPERQAREEDPEALKNFRNRTWKRLKRRPSARDGRSSS